MRIHKIIDSLGWITLVSQLLRHTESFCLHYQGLIETQLYRSSHTKTARQAYDLHSAFEWLSEERYCNPGYKSIKWMDIAASDERQATPTDGEDDNDVKEIPLYPLGAVYLPGSSNHKLNNVEPQNMRMAKDLLADPSSPPQFCVTLRALDTGRIANVGTILRIVDFEEQFQDETLARIRLTCQAEELVDIRDVTNPEAFAPENRIRRTSEYLCARVRPLSDSSGNSQEEIFDMESYVVKMVEDYNMLKTIYQLEIDSESFPPSFLFQLGNAMPAWDAATNFSCPAAFWQAAQEWQSVCYTIRQGRQSMLSSDRNELMVDAASKLGPLKLPIHLEDLPPFVRQEVQLMEVEAQRNYSELGMDPCLDFQAMMSLRSHRERLLCLTQMVSRERNRLEAVAAESSRKARA